MNRPESARKHTSIVGGCLTVRSQVTSLHSSVQVHLPSLHISKGVHSRPRGLLVPIGNALAL